MSLFDGILVSSATTVTTTLLRIPAAISDITALLHNFTKIPQLLTFHRVQLHGWCNGMRSVSKQALKASAIFCCCIVLLAVTAHLLHIHFAHSGRLGKAEFNECAVCIFSLGITAYAIYLPPVLAVLVVKASHVATHARSKGFLLLETGRAPPISA